MNWTRWMPPKPLIVAIASCLVTALPVLAQEAESDSKRVTGLALFLTWLPVLFFLGIMAVFYRHLRKAEQRARRHDQHMERVEQLLERLARAKVTDERE